MFELNESEIEILSDMLRNSKAKVIELSLETKKMSFKEMEYLSGHSDKDLEVTYFVTLNGTWEEVPDNFSVAGFLREAGSFTSEGVEVVEDYFETERGEYVRLTLTYLV